jgi:hypothetical protein
MNACIIMHNMIVEDERDKDDEANEVRRYDDVREEVRPSRAPTHELQEFLQIHHAINDRGIYSQLQEDLMQHLWQRHGNK